MSEPITRLSIFIGLFIILALLELAIPRRKLVSQKTTRWRTNFIIFALDIALVRLLFKSAAIGAALYASQHGIGLLNVLNLHPVLAFIIAFTVLDFSIWLFHLTFHKVPLFWRLHQVHHTDRDLDFTTALRFHPLEILLSMLYKYAVILALGAPAIAVLAFEVVLNSAAMFNHANIKLPKALDATLRTLIVTPDMHRIHHSTERTEHDSNYGFNLSIWDKLFNTYTKDPKNGTKGLTIGLKEHQTTNPNQTFWSLLLPFKNK